MKSISSLSDSTELKNDKKSSLPSINSTRRPSLVNTLNKSKIPAIDSIQSRISLMQESNIQGSSNALKGSRASFGIDGHDTIKDFNSGIFSLPPISNTAAEDVPFEHPTLKTIGISSESSVSDFRNYQRNTAHPATVLKVSSEEDDRKAFTEFDILCNELLAVMGEMEGALEEMSLWKDDFLKQSVPSNIKLQLATLFARMLRSKSDLHEPVFELARQIKMYSRPWVMKRNYILELESDYTRHNLVLDVAIRKLEQMQLQIDHVKSQHRVALWERLTARLFDYLPLEKGSKLAVGMDVIFPVGTGEKKPEEDEESEEEDEGPFMTSLEFKKFCSLIRDYIAKDSPAKAKLKKKVLKFKKLLSMQHPNYEIMMEPFLKRPFVIPTKMPYVSFRSGTIIKQKFKKFPLPKAISLIDLRPFAFDKAVEPKKFDENGWEIPVLDESISVNQDKRVFAVFEKQQPLVRCNSSHTLYALGKKAELRRAIQLPVDAREINRLKYTLNKKSNKSRWRSMDEDSDIAYSSSSSVHENEDMSSENSELFLKDNFLDNFNPEDLHDAVNKFFIDHPEKKFKISTEENEITGDVLDEKKDLFTLKEVIELTLLHAQQVNFLQENHEQKNEQTMKQLNALKNDHAETMLELQKRLTLATAQNYKLTQELSKRVDEYPKEQKKSSLSRSFRASPANVEIKTKVVIEEEISEKADSEVEADAELLDPVTDESLQDTEEATEIISEATPKKKKNRAKKPFMSSYLAMTFMERLRVFTEMALRRRRETREKTLAAEFAVNEERLNSIKLIRSKDNEDSGKNEMIAEFMPMPGQIPIPKGSDIIQKKIPWGGRFKTTKAKATNKINILNLFDVAMHIERPAKKDS